MHLKRQSVIMLGLIWILSLSLFYLLARPFISSLNSDFHALDKLSFALYFALPFLYILILLGLTKIVLSKNKKKPKSPHITQNVKFTPDSTDMTQSQYVESLHNQPLFNAILKKAVSNAKRHNKILAVLIVHLNLNKNIDAEVNTLILREIEFRLSEILRASDIFSPIDETNLIVLLNDIYNPKFAGPVAQKILLSCTKPITIFDNDFSITANIGVAIFPNDGQFSEDLRRNATTAMQKAKYTGKSIYQYYSREMDIAAHEHIKLKNALRHAIKNNEFKLYYQPQFNVKTKSIDRVEALIRWEQPELGLLNPEVFIPLAEETGLIMQIGEWALREACRANKIWKQEGYEIIVAVNVSAKQFHGQDIAQIASEALMECDLSPDHLEIEITETAIIDNINTAIIKLHHIHSQGIRICIDDFGAGYTSISHLKKFPVSVLKIDQNFIKGIPYNQNDLAITTAVIALGHNLGLDLVAEGVETEEQFQFLAKHHCDFIQGYYLGQALPANEITALFAKQEKIR